MVVLLNSECLLFFFWNEPMNGLLVVELGEEEVFYQKKAHNTFNFSNCLSLCDIMFHPLKGKFKSLLCCKTSL